MSTHPTERPLTPWETGHDNKFAVQVLLDCTGLPAPTVTGRPEAVYVSVTDVDDLGRWLDERGGEIHVSAPFEGVQLWTLHTRTPARADGSSVLVLVSVPVPVGELVMSEILAAVTR